jgi:Bacterial Ig domain
MMKNQFAFKMRPVAAAGAALLALLAVPAQAVTYTVVAEAVNQLMPDGVSVVPMWGYRVSAPGGDLASALAAPITSPGAALVVPPANTVLSVTLHNRLSGGAPTSFVVHGLNTAMAPVFADAGGAVCVPGAGATDAIRRACRVRSFTAEAAAGGAPVVYTYANVRPGTYLYQSGTQPQIQVQMGLYGLMSKDAAAGVVYPGVAYANQSRVLFSEVDPGMHASVAAGSFTGSTLDYDPKHFRTHVYDAATQLPVQVDAGAVPQFIGSASPYLIRMVNAGLQTRVPTLSEGTWALLGEDAQPYPYAREQYTAMLPAAKTMEAWLATARTANVFDRRMAFGDSANGVAGQLLQVSTTPVIPTNLSANCPVTGTQGLLWSCLVTSTTPGATLALVGGPLGMTSASTAGGLLLNWTPTNEQAQRPANPSNVNPVMVRASSASNAAQSRSFNVAVTNVNDAPTATADSAAGAAGVRTLAGNVLSNDRDIDGDTLNATLVTGPVDGTLVLNADGSFNYTLADTTLVPQAGLTRSFTYRANDDGTPALSAQSTVTLSFVAGLRANPDAFTLVNTNARPTQTVNVIANDTSTTTPAFQENTIRVSRTDPGAASNGFDGMAATATQGEVQTPFDALNNGVANITYRAPPNTQLATSGGNIPIAFSGTDSFWYRITSGAAGANANTPTNWTKVDVTIAPPAAPATVDDSYTFNNTLLRPAQTFVVLANDTSVNGFNNISIEVAREADGVGATFDQLAATPTRGLVDTPFNNGTITYRSRTDLPANGSGTDYFYYRVRNASGVPSAWTRVNVTMN